MSIEMRCDICYEEECMQPILDEFEAFAQEDMGYSKTKKLSKNKKF